MTELADPASEAIQRHLLVSMYERCPAAARAAMGLELEAVADALVSMATHDPSILINRCHGLGSLEPVKRATIDAIVASYRRRGIERYFVHVHAGTLPREGAAWLDDAGLEKTRSWVQFVRGSQPAPDARTDLRVEQIDERHAGDFARIACSAFGLETVSRAYVAAIVGRDDSRVYMSFDGDVPAGVGAMFVRDGCAYLGFGATDPAYRRRGSQGAIMVARIRAALDAGCERMFTETGEAVAGEDQLSYRNILRYGFEARAVCENWAPRAWVAVESAGDESP